MSVHDLEEARIKRALRDLNFGTDDPPLENLSWTTNINLEMRTNNACVIRDVIPVPVFRVGGKFVGMALGLSNFMPECNWPLDTLDELVSVSHVYGPPKFINCTPRDYFRIVDKD